MSGALEREPYDPGTLESARPPAGELGSSQWAILEAIARGAWLPELLLSIVSLVEHQADGMLCSLLLYDPSSGTLRHGAARRLAPELCAAIDGIRVGPSSGSCGMAAFHRQRVVVTDITTHPAWAAYWEPFLAHGLRACWSTPILSPSGQLLGTLCMYFGEPRGPTPSECAWADAATHLAAIALSRAEAEREHARLLRALEARVQELTLLHDCARLLQAHRVGLEARLEALVKMIPRGFRRSERCRARIRSHGVDVSTPGFVDGPLKQTAQAPAGEHSVSIEVVYLDAPAGDAFVVEEQTLLESLADLVGAHLEKHHAEATLRETLAELREKNQRLEFHVSRMPLGLVVWDRERRVTQWNPAAERIFGWSAAHVLGKSSSELGILPDPEQRDDALARERGASDGGLRGTHEHVHRDGTRLVCDWLHAPLKDEQDRVIGYLSMAHDVSERQRAEQERARLEAELQRGQRLQALGTLAGGIAHDFNNILTAIAGHAHLGLSDIEEERSPKDSLQAIQEASARAVELVRRILMFSRPPEPERKACNIGPIVEEVMTGFRASTAPAITFEARVDPRAPLALADPVQIHQVLANLVANSIRAVGERGRIMVEVDAVPNDHEDLIGSGDARFARYVRVTVSDTGVGMDERTRERMFEPFFSTKPSGQGTGLGLSVVHGIVKSHEGSIRVSSKAGQGSVIAIYLPEAAAPEIVARPPSPSRPPSAGAHVIYVDDEEPLVALATRWLGRLGYKVSGFSDAREALEAFRQNPHGFDALISDVSMPELSGLDLVRQVLAIRPDMVVVMSSGYLTPEDRQRAIDAGALDVVLKPQSMGELGRILHGILSERSGAAAR